MSGHNLKRITFALVLMGLLGYLASSLMEEASPPAERIRHLIEDAVDDFNDQDLRVRELFSPNYRDANGAEISHVRALMNSFMYADEEDFHAQLEEGQLKITVGESGREAQVVLSLLLLKDDQPWKHLRGVFDLEKEGANWRAVESHDVSHLPAED